jgi:hypothetical protein
MRPAASMVSLVCVVMMASAVDASAQGLGYGVKGGVTLADLQEAGEEDSGSFDFRTGFVVGGFVTWPLGGRLVFQPEGLFTQKGQKVDQGGGTSTAKLDYLDVPLLVSYRLMGSPERHFAVFGGPAVGIRVRARSSGTFGGGSTLETDISDQVKPTDFSVVGGLAYHRGRLVLDGRYSWGLSDIDEESGDDFKIRNRGISFLAGWNF